MCAVRLPLNFTCVGLDSKRLVPEGTEKLHSIPEELVCLNKDTDRHSVVIEIRATGGECYTKSKWWLGG